MQTALFEENDVKIIEDQSNWGTFKDSLRAPIHNWFTYPAGFSYKAVEKSIRDAKLNIGKSTIYDPFMGSGTTNLVAKSLGFDSVGVEAHPFVHRITKSKFEWNIDYVALTKSLNSIEKEVIKARKEKLATDKLEKEFPELILKCFLPETLYDLLIIRNSIREIKSSVINEFLRTGLICVLRDVSIAATGWPYIAPKKVKITSMSKMGFETYKKRILKMYSDVEIMKKKSFVGESEHRILLGDSRNTVNDIKDESCNHIFTSPPYLNNFDYADRTRLELYFMGEAKNWSDISGDIRTKLMTSATTQISRLDKKYSFLESFKQECGYEYDFLSSAVEKLSELRLIKGGKKSYDLLVTGYFNDIYQILKDNFRVLKKGSRALYILGDSAPYGVHIPTDSLIGQIGVSIGFKKCDIQVLRERGGKWANNPQRHNVMLRESVVILEK